MKPIFQNVGIVGVGAMGRGIALLYLAAEVPHELAAIKNSSLLVTVVSHSP